MAKDVKVQMVVEKECKSCVRFKAATPEANKLVSTVYINNAALEQIGSPDKIELTISAGK
jgi:hypothetical protein